MWWYSVELSPCLAGQFGTDGILRKSVRFLPNGEVLYVRQVADDGVVDEYWTGGWDSELVDWARGVFGWSEGQ